MDKRKLRQSAVADFMQSLAHLDELLGDTTETSALDDEPKGSASDRTAHSPKPAAASEKKRTTRAFVNPDADA